LFNNQKREENFFGNKEENGRKVFDSNFGAFYVEN
jgi:hypothetical protein